MNAAPRPHVRIRRLAVVLGVVALRALHAGLRAGLGCLDGTAALLANASLVPQFPLMTPRAPRS